MSIGFMSLLRWMGGRCVIGLAHSGELTFATQASWCFSGVGSVSRSLKRSVLLPWCQDHKPDVLQEQAKVSVT